MEQYRFSAIEQKMIEQMPVPMAVYQFVNEGVSTLAVSEGYRALFHFPDLPTAYHYLREDAFCNTHPDDISKIKEAAYRFAKEDETYEVIFRSRKYDGGEYQVIHGTGKHIFAEDGTRLAYVWYMDEGTYTEKANARTNALNRTFNAALHEESILRSNYYSYLTGLPSMSYFFELALAKKDAILKEGGIPAFLYMDLGGMKRFNIKHGFAKGDVLLKDFAQCLQKVFSEDVCSHFGADHFAVVTEVRSVEEKLNALFERFREMSNEEENLPVHVGVFKSEEESVSATLACDQAKTACDTLKGTYSSGFAYYDQKLEEAEEDRQYFIKNIDRAIQEKWIKLYLQPIIRTVNGLVCDAEALARWDDPNLGVVSPARFIPPLEKSGLIYKLDLYMVDQVVESIKIQKEKGFDPIPNSINLSRADFDACDIVEEIRRRVDDAGIERERITVEITESIIGSDFEFMKEQVARFQNLGFSVWMDDFGSGYSSLDILQSINFDLLKFDASFMRRFNEGENGRILLTELVKMATSLGMDTVCEGVETEEQVRFLQEIGCSKLQGFYYTKPIPFEKIGELDKSNSMIANENPEEAEYYETIGRINLYDLGVIAGDETNDFHNVFNTLPMAIVEVMDEKTRYARSNRSYQEFMQQFFHLDILKDRKEFGNYENGVGMAFYGKIKQACETGNRVFFDEKMSDGSMIHSLVRKISTNPVTGSMAVAIAVLSISEPNENATYEEIARSLAADYYNIYLIDLDTNEFIEYTSKIGDEEMSLERHGGDFFASARRDTMTRIYAEDREPFLELFTKENVLKDIEEQGVFTTTYRLIDSGKPVHVNMKVTRMKESNRLILGVSIIDTHVKQKEYYRMLQRERELLVRVMALTDGYLSLFSVDPETGHYVEYSSTEDFDSLGAAKSGDDFFAQSYIDAGLYLHPSDRERFQKEFTLENVLREIKSNGSFRINYQLVIKDVPRPVTLKAALIKEVDADKLVVGVREWKDRKKQ